jgi:hypothetical protein
MGTQFYIVLSVKTIAGPECFGKFFIGNKRSQAMTVFQSLKGDRVIDNRHKLLIEVMECAGDLPLNIDMVGCTLEQFGENCKIIAREAFKTADAGQ